MRHKELLTALQNLTHKHITQQDIANALGVNINRISSRASRNSNYSTDEISRLNSYFNINILQDSSCILQEENKDSVIVDYYPEVFGSCKNGTFIPAEEKDKIRVPFKIFTSYSPKRKYSVIKAFGDSMIPFICNGDNLLVELSENREQIRDNTVYVFRYKDRIYCKRLVDNIKQVIIKSDNLQYDPVKIEYDNEINDFQIIARIIGIVREVY